MSLENGKLGNFSKIFKHVLN